jgi:hypothetical protein
MVGESAICQLIPQYALYGSDTKPLRAKEFPVPPRSAGSLGAEQARRNGRREPIRLRRLVVLS